MKEKTHKDMILKSKTVEEFRYIVENGCSRCSLSQHRCGPIVYRGNPNSDILLLGEAPGKVEIEQRKPFCGPAGQLLDRLMNVVVGLDTNKDM